MEIKVFEYGDRYIMQQPLILELSEQSLPTAGSPPADQLVNLNVVLLIDQAGQIIYVSRESQSLLGIADNMLVGKPVTRLLPSLALVCNANESNLSFLTSNAHYHGWQRLEINHRMLSAHLSQTQLFGQVLTVVELRRAQLPQTELHLQRFIQNLGDWDEMLVVTDTTGRITYVNQSFEDMTSFSFIDVMGKTQEQILGCGKNRKLYQQMWSRLQAGKSYRGVFYSRKNKSQRFYEERFARPFMSEDGEIRYYIFTSSDVSKRERLMQQLVHLANHDELTGLPNRHLFMDRLQQAQAHAARSKGGFYILLLDMDDFKAINDRYGHAAGDAVLMAVANRLRACVRDADTIARLGGDEFAMILNDINAEYDVQQVLIKIASALRKPIGFAGRDLSSHASIGVAHYPQDSLEIDSLLNQADIAMYHVKATGGNGYDMHHQGKRRDAQILRRRSEKFCPGKIQLRDFIMEDTQTNQAANEVKRYEDPNPNTEEQTDTTDHDGTKTVGRAR